MKNLAVFASGNGSNCENLIRHFSKSDLVRVKLVVCNRPEAKVLVRAKSLGVPTALVTKAELQSAEQTLALLREHGIDFIVLAGFLLMVPDYLIAAYPRRIVNIHPALLPKYGGQGMYGHHVHEAVKAAGETETGITIHYVSEVCDGGEIIAQFRTPVAPDDTPDDIARKVHRLEMRHFAETVEELIETQA